MKRLITIIVLAVALLTAGVGSTAAQEQHRGGSDFCYGGWIRSSHSSLPVGNCNYIEDTYYCPTSGESEICHRLVCQDGSSSEETCQPD